MIRTLPREILGPSVAALLFLACFFLISSGLIADDKMAIAISIDLLVSVPVAYYLLIRKTAIPKTTVVLVLVVGMLIGFWLLPEHQQGTLNVFKTYFLPLVEMGAVLYVLLTVRKVRKKLKSAAKERDFFLQVTAVAQDIFPSRLVRPFATELAVLYYGFFHWKNIRLSENEFSYHKETGTQAILGALIFAVGIETVVLHILLVSWNPTVAWILTALSVYTAFQVFGILRSLSKRPIMVSDEKIHLKYGIMNEVEIAWSDIASIEKTSRSIEGEERTRTLSAFSQMEGHNIILNLRKEYDLIGFYGFKKKFVCLALHLDKPQDFYEKVQEALGPPELSNES